MIIVVLSRPTARAVSDILVFVCDSVTSPTLPHAARVSVYLVPYIACRDTVESEAGRRMRRRPFPTLLTPPEVW